MSIVQESVILNSKLKTELIIENFEIMTLEERLEFLNNTATKLVIALCGNNYKRQYESYV